MSEHQGRFVLKARASFRDPDSGEPPGELCSMLCVEQELGSGQTPKLPMSLNL
jgi:hypothetical protein